MVIRVLHVVSRMTRAGQETHLMRLYRRLAQDGVQFDFVVQSVDPDGYDDEIRELGGRVHVLPPVQRHPIRRYRELRDLVRSHNYDVVHRHSDKSLEFLDLVAARSGGARMRIYHAHNPWSRLPWLHIALRPMVRLFATHFMSVSSRSADYVFGRNFARRQGVPVIRNAPELSELTYDPALREAVRCELGLQNAFVVGHVGRFEKQKNHRFLLDVFASVLRSTPNAVLLLCGDGSARAQIARRCRELGVTDAVRMLGVRRDIPRVLHAIDVFAFPSLFEGLGGAVIEAQALGIPCVMSNGVPPEALINKENSERLDLAAGVDFWASVVSTPRERVRHHDRFAPAGFDLRRQAADLARLYRSVGSDRSTQRRSIIPSRVGIQERQPQTRSDEIIP